jgi:hypothetical protein
MPNLFDLENCIRCFNHTLQLSAKTLLHPFNVGLGQKTTEDSNDNDGDELLDEELDDTTDNDDDNDNDGLPDVPDVNDIDDGIDKMNALDADEQEEMLADTAAVRQTVTKVCVFMFMHIRLMYIRQLCAFAFAIVRSTAIALPAWCRYCKEFNLRSRILSRDVVTRWNST